MNYFLLRQRRIVDDDGEDLEAHELVCEDDRIADLPWRMGVRFKNPPVAPIALSFEDEENEVAVFRDYASTPLPLVSHRLKSALEVAGTTNVEFYATSVRTSERFDEFPGYWAINVVGLVDVVDEASSSSWRAFGSKGADLLDRFVPRAITTDMPIFRMAEQLSTLIVSGAVKQACEARGIETLEFVPLPPVST